MDVVHTHHVVYSAGTGAEESLITLKTITVHTTGTVVEDGRMGGVHIQATVSVKSHSLHFIDETAA